jgi:hypothetical protein
MSALACRHLERWTVAALFVALAVVAGPADAPAQATVRLDGTVNWVTGNTLVFSVDPQPVYVTVDGYLVPALSLAVVIKVDLSRIRQSDYSFMKSGERLAVIGIFDGNRHVFVATSLIRGPDLQAPFQAP